MSEISIDHLAREVAALRRENRRLKRAGGAAAIALVAAVAMGQARPAPVLEAQRFVLKNAEGRVRGEIAADERGGFLVLHGPHGDPAVSLRGADDPAVTLAAPEGRKTAAIQLGAEGMPAALFVMEDKDTRGRTSVWIGSDGAAQMKLTDKDRVTFHAP
jgi:hypothetical protein